MGCCESKIDEVGKHQEIHTEENKYILIWDPIEQKHIKCPLLVKNLNTIV